jgi:hypothetical protein
MIQIDFCSIIYDLNYIWNLKLTQCRNLCKIFKSSRMKSLNIFGVGERFLFEFSSLSGVSKFENYLTRPGPHVSGLFSFDRSEQSPSPTRRPCSRWPRSPSEECSVPVVAGRRRPRGLPPPCTTAPDVTEEAVTHFTFPLPPFSCAPLYSAPTGLLLHPPLPVTDESPRAVQPGQKECLIRAPLLHQELARSAS